MSYAEPDVRLICEDCGCDFVVTASWARRIRRGDHPQKCRRHARTSKAVPVTDTDRRFWLTRFTDVDLASFASALFDLPFDPSRFTAARARVMGEPAVMVAAGVAQDEREAA